MRESLNMDFKEMMSVVNLASALHHTQRIAI